MKIKWNHKKYLTNPKESRERKKKKRTDGRMEGKSYADNFKPNNVDDYIQCKWSYPAIKGQLS